MSRDVWSRNLDKNAFTAEKTRIKQGLPVEKKPLLATAFILALLTSAVAGAQFNVGYATGTPADVREVLVFLRDVVQLDMAKYNAILMTNATNYWLGSSGIAQTDGQYRLDSTGFVDSTGECGTSILTVTFTFWGNKLISCDIYEESRGPPLYSKQPPTDLWDAASGFLQRYQTYTGDTQLSQMRNLLDMVEVTSNTTETADSLSLEVKVHHDHTYLTWGNTLNGADYSRLRLEFDNWGFSRFYDDRSFYKLGSSEVNISQGEAESIALKSVESYQYANKSGVANFNIIEENIRSRFSFLNRDDYFVKYSIWIVDLPFDQIYPGGASYIEVMLWADLGEVISIEALGAGYPYEEPSPAQTPTSSPLPEPEPFPTALVFASVITVAVVGVGLLVYFKKRRAESGG